MVMYSNPYRKVRRQEIIGKGLDLEKYVYKITNNITGKVYIGQTNNLKRRIQEHKHDKRCNHPMYTEIHKYGFENFDVEVLYFGSNYDEEEKKYIRLYHSCDKNFGYNITPGGQGSAGEWNPASTITQATADALISDLLNSDLSKVELAEKYNVNKKFIDNVNTGVSWRKPNIKYPIREPEVKPTDEKVVNHIIEMLKDESITIDDIVCNTGIHRSVILSINKGKTHLRETESYPIRELGLKKCDLRDIQVLLRDTNIPIKEIAARYNQHVGQIYRINSGQSWYEDSLHYPIRNLSIERDELGKYKCGNQSSTVMGDYQHSQVPSTMSLASR